MPTRPTLDAVLSPADRDMLARKREEAATLTARLGEVEGKARSARRDALRQELQRLMEMASAIKKVGHPRMAGDMAQTLARQIADVSRRLAEAEQALPPGQRSAVPAGAAGAAATPAAAEPGPEAKPQPAAQATPSPAAAMADAEEARRLGRESARGLLSGAADLLEELLEVVREAERLEAILDPEAAEERRRAIGEITRDAAGLRALAGALAEGTVRISA